LFGKFGTDENSFLGNYNNLIFLQKAHKLKHRKSPTAAVAEEIKNMKFEVGEKLIFNMFSNCLK